MAHGWPEAGLALHHLVFSTSGAVRAAALVALVHREDSPEVVEAFSDGIDAAGGDDLLAAAAASPHPDLAGAVLAAARRHHSPLVDDAVQAHARWLRGAVEQLVQRQAPITRTSGPEFEFGAAFTLRYPDLALFAKYAAFLGGIFLLLRAVDTKLFFSVESRLRGAFPRMGSGVIAAILTFIFFMFSEPYLLKAAPPSDFRVKLTIPVIGTVAAPATPASTTTTMDIKTILSITVFALLQIGMYVICLAKISEIARSTHPSATKLRLMENEENLFDGGLYIGIAGTATALVLQVVGVIDANLLAAYSSNLFGIVCVALVKIRHVRPYKQQLILEVQSGAKA